MASFVYFISSHGFGHAARAVSIIAALRKQLPNSRITLMTSVPPWFFSDSLGEELPQEEVARDVGLIQSDPFSEDLPATIASLRQQVPFADPLVNATAERLEALKPDLVLCDIAPLGLAAAQRAGIPSVLIENFTWSYIYKGYGESFPEILPLAEALEEVFNTADLHIQTTPVCVPKASAVRVAPISRLPRHSRSEVRQALGIPEAEPMILVTMGGIEWQADSLHSGRGQAEPWLVVPGGGDHRRKGRLIRLPHRSRFYHPDLIEAADLVVGKLGYSTVAEVHRAGLPFAYLGRPAFAESAHLEAWVQSELPSHPLTQEELRNGRWLKAVERLIGQRSPRRSEDGADEVCSIVLRRLDQGSTTVN